MFCLERNGKRQLEKPYIPMSTWTNLNDLRKLSYHHKQRIHSSLNDEDITDEEYEHAQKIWRFFSINNLGGWHNLYLKLDVLLLADVFENFRELSMSSYGLDPAWYYTTPGLA